MLKSEQELPSVSSETFYEPHHSLYKSEINEENKALATHGNSTLGGFGGKTNSSSIVFSLLVLTVHSPLGPLRA